MNERRGSDIRRPTSHPWLQLTIALGLITPTKIQSTVLLEGEHLWTSGLAMRRKLMPSGNENRTIGLNVSSTLADFTTARTATCSLKPKRTRASLHNSKAHRPRMNVTEYCECACVCACLWVSVSEPGFHDSDGLEQQVKVTHIIGATHTFAHHLHWDIPRHITLVHEVAMAPTNHSLMQRCFQ